MKILIDARKLGDGGIGVHIENLVDSLLNLEQFKSGTSKISLLVNPSYLDGSNTENPLSRWKGQADFYPEASAKYSFGEYFLMPLRNRALINSHDIYHSPHYTLPFFIKIPSLATVHDLIHLSHPENFYHRPIGRLLINSAAKRAKAVIFVSKASKNTFQKEFPGSAANLRVIPNALRGGLELDNMLELKEFREKKGLSGDYLLFVGSDRPHKGFRELLEAVAKLKDRSEKLLVVGKRFSRKTAELIAKLGLEDRIKFLGELSHKELSLVYHSSKLVVVPSRVEGFGLVGLEGMKCGKPVVCSPIRSLEEVCGEVAFYSKGLSSDSLAEVILRVLENPDLVKEKMELGALRIELFSQEALGESMLELYNSVLGNSVSKKSIRRAA